MRLYNDTLIIIPAILPGLPGPRRVPRRLPYRRAKCADPAAGARRTSTPEEPGVPGRQHRLRGRSKRRARVAAFGVGAGPQRRQGIAGWRVFVTKDQEAILFPSAEQRFEPDRGSDFRNRQNTALLGGFYRMDVHPFAIDPAGLGPAG